MRIQLILPGLSIGGTEKMVLHLARYLKEKGHAVQVISLKSEGPVAETLRGAGVQVISLNTPAGLIAGIIDTPRVVRRLRTLMTDFRPDVVQSFLTRANVLTRAAARSMGIRKVVGSFRVMEKQKLFHLWAERLFLDPRVLFTTNSNALKQFAMQAIGLAPNRVEVIYNGVDSARAVQEVELAALREQLQLAGKKMILAAGRLHKQKGFDILINAFAHVVEKEPAAQLFIAGEGEEQGHLEDQVKQNRLSPHVRFLGLVKDLAPYFRAADVFVLSSRWEGTPNVVLESMRAGCPVVATRVGGMREILSDAEEGQLVPPEDPAALSQAITDALSHPDLAAHRAQKALLKAQTFSMPNMVRAYETLYSS